MPRFGVKVKKSIYFGVNFPNDTELPDSLLLLPSYFVPWHDLQFKIILISLILGFVQPLTSSSAPTRYFSPSPFKPSFSWLAAPCKQKHQAHRALWFLSFWLTGITRFFLFCFCSYINKRPAWYSSQYMQTIRITLLQKSRAPRRCRSSL